MIGKAIYNLLSNDATVSASVGTNIFPYVAIEDTPFPYIVYTQSDLEPHDTKDGVSAMDVIKYEVEVWHENPESLKVLADAVRDVLDRYTGTVEGLNIQSVHFQGENTDYTDDNRIYLTMQLYSFRLVV